MEYQDIITIEPGKRSGKLCIRGMRITVYDILEYLAGGMTEAEILEDFSELTSELDSAKFYGCATHGGATLRDTRLGNCLFMSGFGPDCAARTLRDRPIRQQFAGS